jgi:anti-sigma regulatory factor (Ser/Thr protein kinase)
VTDCGCGFELSPDDDTPEVGEADERGRGIKLMRLLADSVSIVRRQQGGTCVRIVKLFRP